METVTLVAPSLTFRSLGVRLAYALVMASGPDLRPRTVGELLDGAFFLYRRHFGRFLLLATIVSLPTLILAGVTAEMSADVLRDAVDSSLDSIRHPQRDPMEALQQQLSLNMRTQTYGLVSTVLQALSRGGAIAVMAVSTWAALHHREMPGIRETLRRAAPRIPAAVLAYASQAFLGFLLVCCMPIGVIALVMLTPVPALVVFEVGATERTIRGMLPSGLLGTLMKMIVLPPAQVVDGTFRSILLGWHALTIVRGTGFVSALYLFVTFFVLAGTSAISGIVGSLAVAFWVQHYCEVLFLPMFGIAVTLWYVDLRVRREAADLFEGELALA